MIGVLTRDEALRMAEEEELDLVEMPEGQSEPVKYDQLASALGVPLGERMPVHVVRDAVIRLRASKGMVLDAHDQDSVSSGSIGTPSMSTRFGSPVSSLRVGMPWMSARSIPRRSSFSFTGSIRS